MPQNRERNGGIRIAVEAANFDKMLEGLGKRLNISPSERRFSIRVGYRADYAIYVHEDLTMHHTNGKAKFLEDPYRRLKGAMLYSIREMIRAGYGFRRALLAAGRFLLSESRKEVPVDTGYLKGSGYVEVVQR